MAKQPTTRMDSHFAELQSLRDQIETIESALDVSPVFLGGPGMTRSRQSQKQPRSGTSKRSSSGRQDRSRSEGTPGPTGVTTSTPKGISGSWELPPAGESERPLQETVREAVDSYMQSMSSLERCRVPPVNPPRYESGGDWRCFLAEFEEMVELADLKPTHQLAYFKQAVPKEARKMLYQHKVGTIQQAKQLLQELYEPEKDTWTVLNELEKIKQKPGERLRVLAGRIEEVARKYSETLETTSSTDLEKLVISRFKHALADEETRNHLLWDPTVISLDDMVQKAQRFQDARQSSSAEKKTMRTHGEDPETVSLKRQIQELKKQIEELKQSKTTAKRTNGICWNCGKKGHYLRDCRSPRVKSGFSYHPRNLKEKSDSGKQALNWKSQR